MTKQDEGAVKLRPYNENWDLGTIPEDALKSEWARRNAKKRKSYTGGIYWAKHKPKWPGCRCHKCMDRRAKENAAKEEAA